MQTSFNGVLHFANAPLDTTAETIDAIFQAELTPARVHISRGVTHYNSLSPQQKVASIFSVATQAGLGAATGRVTAGPGTRYGGELNFAPRVNLDVSVPGRVQSRINLKTGNNKTGFIHAVNRHFDPSKAGASQFSVTPDQLKAILQSKEVVSSPVIRSFDTPRGSRFVREVQLGERTIGYDVRTQSNTSTLTVMTDKFGNLVTTHPGR